MLSNPNDRNLKLETDGGWRMDEGRQKTAEKGRKGEKKSRKIEKNRGF
jgi:hypothetical protein